VFANRFTAFVDACVLASALKRNLILSLAEAELYRVRWSQRVIDETEQAIARMLVDRGVPDAKERAGRACKTMTRAFDDAMVEQYEALQRGLLALPDPGDAHVLAAAVKTRADVIVTDNLKDFPAELLEPYGIEPKSADDFVADAIDLHRDTALMAIERMRLRFRRPPKSPQQLAAALRREGMAQTAELIKPSSL